jgi:hypothetical protein
MIPRGVEGSFEAGAMPSNAHLNWRLGFFRLWLISSALFVVAVAYFSYHRIKGEFDEIALMKWVDEQHAELIVPQLCGKARGIAGTDFSTKDGQSPGPWDLYAKPNPFDNCWYAISKFRPLYPEFDNLSDNDLSSKLYAASGMPLRDPPRPWMTIMQALAIAFGVPLIALVFGLALGWALAGFAAKQERRPDRG